MKVSLLISLIFVTLFGISSAASNKEEYELSEKCGKRAEELFKGKFENSVIQYNYQSHYNKKMNKCFMYVFSMNLNALYDVNENKEYGMIIFEKGNVDRCRMLNKSCKSEDEWDSFVKSYMEE